MRLEANQFFLFCFWLSYVVFLSRARKNVGMSFPVSCAVLGRMLACHFLFPVQCQEECWHVISCFLCSAWKNVGMIRLCVCVRINKRSFEPFICLDLVLECQQSFLFQIFFILCLRNTCGFNLASKLLCTLKL